MSPNASDSHPTKHASSKRKSAQSIVETRSPGLTMDNNPFTTSIEANADRLMDEVFVDLERMLERGVQMEFEAVEPAQPTKSEARSSVPSEKMQPDKAQHGTATQALLASSLAVLPKVSPRQLNQHGSDSLDTIDPTDADVDLLIQATQERQQPQDNGTFDKLLFTMVLASMAIAASSWWYFRDQLPHLNPIAAPAPPSPTLVSQQDAAFLDYVKRSVERLERAAEAETKVATGTPAPTVLERVYIYQPPAAGSPATGSSVTGSPLPSVPIPANPAFPSSTPTLITPPPAVPIPASPAPSTPNTATIPNISPSPTHALIGLLELGDRSAALFEIDGATQRIQLGERIGSSGWTLVSIANQEAIIRRNGEVRSIYIGQQF